MAYEPDLIGPIFQAYSDERVEDIALNQKLIDIAKGELKFRKGRGYALDELARRYDLPPPDKESPWRLRYAELDALPLEMWPADAVEYPKQDAVVPFKIWQGQQLIDQAAVDELGSRVLHQAPRRAQYDLALRLASIWGVRTNSTRVSELKAATERRMYELWKEGWTSVKTKKRHAPLTASAVTYTERKKVKGKVTEKKVTGPLVRPSGTKNMAAAQALVAATFAALGKPVPMTEPKGNSAPRISTSRDTCILSGNDVLEDFADYARTGTLIKRIEDLAKGVDLPLQPRYDSLLESGRTSSSKGKNKKPLPRDLVGVQIQNFPRSPDDDLKRVFMEMFGHVSDARSTLEPRDGNGFILADYSSGELHTLAQCHKDWFGQSTLGDMLNLGMDVHLWFGALAYGPRTPVGLPDITYEDALARYKAGDKEVKGWRQSAKPIVFGRPGGMGAKKMVITARKSYGVRFTIEEAKRLIALYDNAVKELPMQFDMVSGLLGGHTTCRVLQVRSLRWRGGCSYSAANNTFFQGLLADGALDAMFQVARECYACPESPLYGFRIVAFVHDEIVCEGPLARCSDAARRLSAVMEECLNVYTPDYPTPAEPVVTMIWSKDAKSGVSAGGELLAWGT
jgi:DNA polymerase-1